MEETGVVEIRRGSGAEETVVCETGVGAAVGATEAAAAAASAAAIVAAAAAAEAAAAAAFRAAAASRRACFLDFGWTRIENPGSSSISSSSVGAPPNPRALVALSEFQVYAEGLLARPALLPPAFLLPLPLPEADTPPER